METKFVCLKKDKKDRHQSKLNVFSKNIRARPFDHTRNEEVLKQMKIETADEKLRRQLKLATKNNENEQHHYGKNNAEL